MVPNILHSILNTPAISRESIKSKVSIVLPEVPLTTLAILPNITPTVLSTVPILISNYRPAYINIKDAIIFALLRIKKYYNSRYKPKFF